jgi:hypothetical protein
MLMWKKQQESPLFRLPAEIRKMIMILLVEPGYVNEEEENYDDYLVYTTIAVRDGSLEEWVTSWSKVRTVCRQMRVEVDSMVVWALRKSYVIVTKLPFGINSQDLTSTCLKSAPISIFAQVTKLKIWFSLCEIPILDEDLQFYSALRNVMDFQQKLHFLAMMPKLEFLAVGVRDCDHNDFISLYLAQDELARRMFEVFVHCSPDRMASLKHITFYNYEQPVIRELESVLEIMEGKKDVWCYKQLWEVYFE